MHIKLLAESPAHHKHPVKVATLTVNNKHLSRASGVPSTVPETRRILGGV